MPFITLLVEKSGLLITGDDNAAKVPFRRERGRERRRNGCEGEGRGGEGRGGAGGGEEGGGLLHYMFPSPSFVHFWLFFPTYSV